MFQLYKLQMSSAILIPAAFFPDSETDRYILPNGEDMSKFWDIVQIKKAEGTMKDFETTSFNFLEALMGKICPSFGT